jgi:hypothetical protein
MFVTKLSGSQLVIGDKAGSVLRRITEIKPRVRHRQILVLLVVPLVAICAWARALSDAHQALAPTAVLRVETSRPGKAFALGAVGLATETKEFGSGRLSPANVGLARLMRVLGPSVLRIGGNSVDLSWWTDSSEPPPKWAAYTVTPVDLSALQGLLAATGWRVLLGVDLGHFEPARAANEANYAQRILGDSLLGLEIGNEPNDFGGEKDGLRSPSYNVSDYLHEAEAYVRAIRLAAPGVAIYGPALTQKTNWQTQIGSAAQIFTGITQHFYASSTCPGSPPAVSPTFGGLLSPAERHLENEVLTQLAEAGSAANRPTRIGETNTASCMGSPASPSFASALWALDWALRAASSGVQGLNFAGGFGFCKFEGENPICVSSTKGARADELVAQPEYYGLLAARQLEGGRFVPTSLRAADKLPNLTSWATLAPSGTLKIAIDNLATAGPGQPVFVSVPGYVIDSEESMIGPAIDARRAIVLGGSPVNATGDWRPKGTTSGHSNPIVVRPGSAMIVTLHHTIAGTSHPY